MRVFVKNEIGQKTKLFKNERTIDKNGKEEKQRKEKINGKCEREKRHC